MIPFIREGETCSAYWSRLTDEDKADVRALQRVSIIPSMTEWLLARGCVAVNVPSTVKPYTPTPPRPAVPRVPLTEFYQVGAIRRRPAGHVR
jgi:hypothetical protein